MPPVEMLDTPLLTVATATLTVLISALTPSVMHFSPSLRKPLADLRYYKNEVMQADDNLPIGILLCTEKGDTMVKYATAGLEKNIFVQKYLVALPSKEEIENYIKKEIKIKT